MRQRTCDATATARHPLLARLLLGWIVLSTASAASAQLNCLPTCDTEDGKFLAISGDGLVTLSEPSLSLTLLARPARRGPQPAEPSFTIGVFDGESGEPDLETGHWDTGLAVAYEYRLFASPPGGPETPIALDGEIVFPSTGMIDNGWRDFVVTHTASARAPSGVFVYRLEILQSGASDLTSNLFKVRSSVVVTARSIAQPFSFISSINFGQTTLEDVAILFPAFPDPTPSRYDGAWSFYFEVDADRSELSLFDADFDYGRFDGDRSCEPQPACLEVSGQDLDDVDTPNSVPVFATSDAVPEGVADGLNGTTGSPPEDSEDPGPTSYFVRRPVSLPLSLSGVRYDLVLPDGRVFANDNPSGNLEWEQFVISADPACDPSPGCMSLGGVDDRPGFPCADVCLQDATVPRGVYEMRIEGVDLSNLQALRLPQVLCVNATGQPCRAPRTFVLGDTVFHDLNGNGVQDDPVLERGINRVILHLFDDDGMAGQARTGRRRNPSTGLREDGVYVFAVDPEFGPPTGAEPGGELIPRRFTVVVAPENFAPGGALEGLVGTSVGGTPGDVNVHTDEVPDPSLPAPSNNLRYDFGYWAGAASQDGRSLSRPAAR